jgi:hypothetical protein
MHELDKQTNTEKKKSLVHIRDYKLPSNLILANARAVSPCNALLQGSLRMSLDVWCVSKELMQCDVVKRFQPLEILVQTITDGIF